MEKSAYGRKALERAGSVLAISLARLIDFNEMKNTMIGMHISCALSHVTTLLVQLLCEYWPLAYSNEHCLAPIACHL
jgi:hypothetical protein